MNNCLVFKNTVSRKVLPSDIERFWAKVDKQEGGCWIFTGCPTGRYIYFGVGPFEIGVHRFSYMLVHGKIAPRTVILHTCDVPRCVNPEHLIAGTQTKNMADMREKGRGFVFPIYRGEQVGSSKLKEADIRLIRGSFTGRRGDYTNIGKRFNVTPTLIYKIVNRELWKHIV